MLTIDPNDNIHEDKEPPMSFAEIDRRCMSQLIEISKYTLHPAKHFAETQNIILGTIHEILRTLASIHPEPPRLVVPGAKGNG